MSNSTSELTFPLCMEPAAYTGDTCRVELQMYQECKNRYRFKEKSPSKTSAKIDAKDLSSATNPGFA